MKPDILAPDRRASLIGKTLSVMGEDKDTAINVLTSWMEAPGYRDRRTAQSRAIGHTKISSNIVKETYKNI